MAIPPLFRMEEIKGYTIPVFNRYLYIEDLETSINSTYSVEGNRMVCRLYIEVRISPNAFKEIPMEVREILGHIPQVVTIGPLHEFYNMDALRRVEDRADKIRLARIRLDARIEVMLKTEVPCEMDRALEKLESRYKKGFEALYGADLVKALAGRKAAKQKLY